MIQTGDAKPPGVTTPAISKPTSPDLAKLYDDLPQETGSFDPWAAYGKAAALERDGYPPMAKLIYEKLSQLLTAPDMPAWKDFVDPFFWLAKEKGSAPQWFDAYRSNPKNANRITVAAPLLFDFEEGATPARKDARAELNTAVEEYYTKGDTEAVVNALLHSAKVDESYALPMFDLGLLHASGSNWDWAIDSFGKAKSRNPVTADRFGAFTDQWIPKIKQYKSLLSTPDGLRAYLYWRDLQEAMVLCQVNQLRSAVGLAADAASYAALENRPYPYLIAAYAAALAGQSGDVKHMLQLALAHCSSPEDERAVIVLFRACQSPS